MNSKSWRRVWRAARCWLGVAGLCGLAAGSTWAQAGGAVARPATTPAAPTAPAAKPQPQPQTVPKASAVRAAAAASAPAAPRGGKGWQVGPIPAWVVAPPAPDRNAPPVSNAGARREQLVDLQMNHALPRPQQFVRVRSVALDAGALGSVSQWQIGFNPAYQSVVVHHASVLREGQRSERLADARIEPMRREQRLEQQVLDGGETLLLVLADIRVGDAVEVAYSVEGENPIFEGRMSGGMRLAYETPVDLLHHRWLAPAARPLFAKGLASDAEPERSTEDGPQGPLQALRVVRHQVAAIAQEQGTPPWFKAYPAIDISEYRNWAEVDAWAQKLFALPTPAAPAVAARAQAFRDSGLQGEALAAEVLRFVQDEVRYLSVSLGESSHRPKPPQQTLAELLGDCKDKVVLLNALLAELGFQARPALVSMQRNRGIRDYLPSHDLFDHVIMRLDLNGRRWWLDATINGQGLTLASRGQLPYGAALVVGEGSELQAVPPPAVALSRLQFEQQWDFSQPGTPVQMNFIMRATGFGAERWRAALANSGVDPLAQALSGSFARVLPGLQTRGAPVFSDDRQANSFEFRQRFEMAEFGQYDRGAIEVELGAVEMLDVLGGPAETRRRTPFLIDNAQLVESRITVKSPTPLGPLAPPPVEVVDRQFRFIARLESQGDTATFVRRYERRDDQVLPAELQAWREKLLQARQASFGRLRMPLVDMQALLPQLQQLERNLRSARGFRNDTLQDTIMRNHYSRLVDTQASQKVAADSPLAARLLVSRAMANNLLGDFKLGGGDAEQALAIQPDDSGALEAHGVALLGQGRAEEALARFARITPGARPAAVASWMGQVQIYLGRDAEAETLLREAVAGGSGEGREFAMLWLYLAAERQGGRGQSAVDEYVEATDPQKLPGALLRHLLGRIDADAVIKLASAAPEMARLNLAEAHFFIGQRLLLRGQRDEALRAFQRALDTRATPYREFIFAQLELQRAGR